MRKTVLIAAACLSLGLWAGSRLDQVADASPPEADASAEPASAQAPAAVRPLVEAVSQPPAEYSRYRKLDAFARALALLEQYYVRPLDGERLLDAALAGLVDELDPHTTYLPPADAKLLMEDTQGRFGGVGLVVTLRTVEPGKALVQDDPASARPAPEPEPTSEPNSEPGSEPNSEPGSEPDKVEIVMHIDDVIPGGPAEKAGLKVGDLIVAIEDKPIAHYSSLHDAVMVMRGKPGTRAHFTYRRGDGEAQRVDVTRAVVDPPAVEVRYLGEGLGVLRLRDFQAFSARELRQGLAELTDEAKADADAGAGSLRGVVLDLRDNGGGLLDQAIAIVDLFVARGVIVRTRGRQGVLIDEAKAHAAGTNRDLPLVVLINKGSASASEIVAGALQDHERALIVGERSYGKGSVQTPFEIGDGAILKLTTALYYTPDDRLIQASGISPDVRVGPVLPEYVDSRPTLEPERSNEQHLRPEDFGRRTLSDDDPPGPAREAAGADAQLLVALDHLDALARLGR